MTSPLHSDLALVEEIARLRAFLAAIEEVAEEGWSDDGDAALTAIMRLARYAADPTAPVPGRVAQLWREQVEGL